MKRLFLLLGFLFFASPAHATNAVYVSQSGAGVQSGVSCLTAVPASYFNSSANWNGSPTGIQIGPNTTVHLCGTISSTLIAQGSGAAGNPIIILFEPGAKISQPICPATGCLNLDGKTDITVDGNGVLDSFGHLQTVNGIIESTANGSAFPGRTANSRCAEADSSNRVTFQKIEVQNCYVHVVSPLDTTPSAPDPTGIHAAGALTFKVLHSIIHDANWAIYAGNGVGPIEVGWTEIYNIDHGLAVGVINENFVGVSFHDNHVHDLVNWDTTATACSGNPCYHHDGTHMFKTPGGTGNISQIVISSSLFDGDWGIYNTAMNFTELQSGDQTMYNNIYIGTVNNRNLNNGAICNTVGSTGTGKLYNNTVLMSSAQVNSAVVIEGTVDVRNNLINGGSVLMEYKTGVTGVTGGMDYNDFVNGASGTRFYNSALGFRTYAQFNAVFGAGTGQNGNSSTSPVVGVSATGIPQAGAPLINLGQNLTSLGITALNSDTTAGASRNATARPGVLRWDAGAYNSGTSSPSLSFSPNPAAFGNVNTGVTSSLNVTISNVGTATQTYSSIVASPSVFTNGNTGLGGQCPASGTINAGNSCIVKVNFLPVAITAYSGTLTMTGTVNGSGNLTGNGTSSVSIPSVPTGLAAVVGGSSVALSWNPSTGSPTGYLLQRATILAGPYTQIANVTTGTSFTDTSLANGTYYYQVAAYNSAGTSAYCAAVSAVVSTAASATPSPSVIHFGSIVESVTSAPQVITVTSSGTANLVLGNSSAVSLSGANAADFTISANTCTDSLSIAPGGTCQITVTSTPSATGLRQAAVVIISNDPQSPDVVSLDVTGTATVLLVPTSLAFGNQLVKKASSPRSVVFTNQSGSTITFSSVALTTGTQYAISGNSCVGTLATGATCTTSVTFTPTSPGSQNDTLVFLFTGISIGSPQNVAITGTGKKHGVLRVGAAVDWRGQRDVRTIKTILRPWKNEDHSGNT